MKKADMDFLKKANDFAVMKHLGQKDDEGKDYYMSHLLPVQTIIFQLTQDAEVIAAAVLHDVIEDTDATYEEVKELFGERVADLVNEVTHEGTNDNHGYYFPRLQSQFGILIKLIDRASNISRMDSWNEGRKAQYLRKTKFWKSEGKNV